MKILRWLLSHSFLILLIVAVIYGYMFWGNLLGKETPAGKAVAYLSEEFDVVDDFVNAVRAKRSRLNGTQTSDSPVATTHDINDAEQEASADQTEEPATESVDGHAGQPSGVAGRQPERQTKQQALNNHISPTPVESLQTSEVESQVAPHANLPTRSEQTTTSAQVVANKSVVATDVHPAGTVDEAVAVNTMEHGQAGQSTIEKGVVNRSDNSVRDFVAESHVAQSGATPVDTIRTSTTDDSVEQSFVSEEIEKRLDNVDKQGRVIDETRKNEAIKADWINARKSFYQRNYQLSEQSYQNVIENSEDNFDAYGELGNVYFNQGKKQQAASAYFEAAAILVRKGQVNRARSLMGLLRHLDKSKANELQQLIESTMSS